MNIRSDLGWEKYLKPFLYKRLPDGTGWSAVLGTMCALTFMLLVVTVFPQGKKQGKQASIEG